MAQKKRGPGRPRTIERRRTLGLTAEGEQALEWLHAKWAPSNPGRSENGTINEVLVAYACGLGWKRGMR